MSKENQSNESASTETHVSVLALALGEALLDHFQLEVKASFKEGGLDAVDATIEGFSAFLRELRASYIVGPGALSEHDDDGSATAIGIPISDAETQQSVSTFWVIF